MTIAMHKISHPSDVRAWLDPRRASLMIIDMQTDFVAPEGAAARAGAWLGAMPDAVAAAGRLADAARTAGASVTFVGLETSAGSDSPAWRERIGRLGGDPDHELALCRRGSAGAAFCGPKPADGDLVVFKSRYSAFFRTDLLERLRARGVDTVVVCGVTTECCVDATVRDAFHADLHVFLVADACAGYDESLHEATLKSLSQNFAILLDIDQVERAWSQA